MGPTQNDNQDANAPMPADGGAPGTMPGMPPAGPVDQGVGSAMPPEPNPEDVSMGDEAPVAEVPAAPEAPAVPAEGAGAEEAPTDPGAAPQQ